MLRACAYAVLVSVGRDLTPSPACNAGRLAEHHRLKGWYYWVKQLP
jgi:hypothetical protein